jgi:amino acid transporter
MEDEAQGAVTGRYMTQGKQIIFGISLMAPIAIFGTYGVASSLSGGKLPSAYILAFVVMLITAYSYGKMVRVYPTSGSAYGYVQKTIHPMAGFLVGWMLLLDYAFVPMLSVLFLGLALHEMIPAVPAVLWVALFVGLSTWINIRGMQMAIRVNRIMVALQYTLIAAFVVMSLLKILTRSAVDPLDYLAPLAGPDLSWMAVIAGTALVCQSFLGFDAVTTIAEESVQPSRTIPRTLLIVTMLNGAVFILIAYLGSLAYQGRTFGSEDTAALDLFGYLGGSQFQTFFLLISAVSVFTLVVSQQAGISRLLYVMGRDKVFPPRIFCYTHPRYSTPVGGIVVIGLVTVAGSAFFDLVTLASLVNFGAFFAFSFVNACVIIHFYVRAGERTLRSLLMNLLLPGLGLLSNVWLISSLSSQAFLVGGLWFAAGLGYLVVATKLFTRKPQWELFDASL